MSKDKNMMTIYILILIILTAVITITMITLSGPKPSPKPNEGEIQKVEVDSYPTVNDECTFNIKLSDYKTLTEAGCKDGYTRYNIDDIMIDDKNVKVSVVYSDKDKKGTGLYVNDNRVARNVESIANYKFGSFDNKLFVLDKNKETNVLVFNSKGEKVYDLKSYLEKNKVKELATGDTYIKSKNVDPNSFSFYEGYFEFSSKLDKCQGEGKGSRYKVSYKNEKFEKPEFLKLIEC